MWHLFTLARGLSPLKVRVSIRVKVIVIIRVGITHMLGPLFCNITVRMTPAA